MRRPEWEKVLLPETATNAVNADGTNLLDRLLLRFELDINQIELPTR
jgi:hypothetical protein